MEGYGFYQYADQVRYDGAFSADKKQGYGIYTWTDGRRYEGWWYKGKQHGFGTYQSKDGSVKKGIWENGKRVKWFGESAIESINNKTFDSEIKKIFTNENSYNALPEGSSFNKPEGWDQGLEDVRETLDVPLENI